MDNRHRGDSYSLNCVKATDFCHGKIDFKRSECYTCLIGRKSDQGKPLVRLGHKAIGPGPDVTARWDKRWGGQPVARMLGIVKCAYSSSVF